MVLKKMKEKTFASMVASKLSKELSSMDKNKYDEESYYSHPTFYVKNLSEYINLVTKISSIKSDDLMGDVVIFRGISDDQYDLAPGLERLKNRDEDTEMNLINDFLTRRPDAFNGLSDFDILAKMQHYGLPTRLLDFSLNPLIALYFACESKTTKNGRILCHSTFLKNDTSLITNKICSSAVRKRFDECYTVDEYLCNENLSLYDYLREVYLCGETTVVRPKYWNHRIANQAGVFMVFPNNLYDKYRELLIMAKEHGLSYALSQSALKTINETVINDILLIEPIDYYIATYDANNYYLSNECLRIMVNSYRNEPHEGGFWDRINKYFENRFAMDISLKLLDSEIIQNSFCSIIVEAKSKKKILRELSHIGFGADYIYPELEYTAKEIKRKYE